MLALSQPRDGAASEDNDGDGGSAGATSRGGAGGSSSAATGEASSGGGSTARKPRGRPLGSKNKPKPPVIITRASDSAMHPLVLELAGGSDVVSGISEFARRRGVGVSVLDGRGAVADVTLRHPSAGGPSTISVPGRLDMLSLSGTLLPPEPPAPEVVAWPAQPSPLTVSLAGPHGQVIGGTVAGPMTAVGPVLLVAATFPKPEFHRLPVVGCKPRYLRPTLRNDKAREHHGKDDMQKVEQDRHSISATSRSPLHPPPRVAPPPAMSCVAWATPSIVILPRPRTFHRKASLRPNLRAQSHQTASTDTSTADGLPRLLLHDSLNQAGIDTKLARAAREGFCQQIQGLSGISGETSIVVRIGADLAKAALQIAAEDDSLISHSSVPLPVDAFVERMDDLSMGFCSLYMPPLNSPPEVFLGNLERYFYVHKGFRRTDAMSDARSLYLHSALTCRSGSAAILSLIYSEMLKMLKVYGFLDFDVEIFFPNDLSSLPRGYHKQKSQLSDQPHIVTSKSLLVKTLRNLKDAFWPFQHDHSTSLFLRAAQAANLSYGPATVKERYSKSHSNVSGLEIASAKAAHHRIERGVWTIVRFGDMRRALAACERLILLDASPEELRDYAVLLYHCGFYEECLLFLKSYQTSKESHAQESQSNQSNRLEEDLTVNLMTRVKLILGEEGWSKSGVNTRYWGKNSEPW
ncbi:hypothetical protein MUK42_17767 [Musa troglodytarum]|uniref:PPC domain-containing protein n=1 Tax=Musa troglodytarum TaxID=320322 RepID=A0A9E7HBL5_9LILI|nr:hypothetical protein MUK42_17767 [Musa troglodytarum]